MAITRLMHMKEGLAYPHEHLRNAIDYILDIKHDGAKTQHGVLVGGNSGTDHKEVLENFLETKRAFGKTDGRQGYHFVISFGKGETDAATAYAVVQEFCKKYLGDAYDHVFAIHDDKEHMHGHIIFNSVSRLDGYKYHYKKGDWEKYIQPVTDRVCEEHGLAPLTYEEERTGVSYASWAAQQKGKVNWTAIMRADIDFAIQRASTYEEFESIMQQMDYHLKMGYSGLHQKNFLYYQFVDETGKEHNRRSTHKNMAGYGPEEIRERIRTKAGSRSYEEIMKNLSSRAGKYMKLQHGILRSTQTYKRLYQAVSYYKLPNPYAVPAGRVRKDMIRLDRLIEECRYLQEKHITDRRELEKRLMVLNEKQQELLAKRKILYSIQDGMDTEQLSWMEQYNSLQRQLMQTDARDSRFEKIEDAIHALEAKVPHEMLEVKIRIEEYRKEIASVRKEKRLIQRLLEAEVKKDMSVTKHPVKI